MESAVDMGDHNTRLALLEKGQAEAKTALRDVEDRLTYTLREIRDVLLKNIDELRHDIRGNGKPGIIDRLLLIEKASAVSTARDEETALAAKAVLARADRNWSRFVPWIPWILMILFSAAAFQIGRIGK